MAEIKNEFEVIKNRRNPKIVKKEDITRLLLDSYEGGTNYVKQGYLDQYPKEYTADFKARKKKSVYQNNVQPVADEIAGYLFKKDPERIIPSALDYLTQNASGGQTMDTFMKNLAIKTLMVTEGVLIDSPAFDSDFVETVAERNENNLNPFVVTYSLDKIRDYHIDQNNVIQWVMLDNTHIDNSNPLVEPKAIKTFRLWSIEFFVDFLFTVDSTGKEIITKGDEIPHPIGYVPFKFVSWKDPNNELIPSTVFEDMGLIDKKIYNVLSYMDEMLAAGTFDILLWPGEVPELIIQNGLGSMSAVGYSPVDGQSPHYAGAGLKETTPYLDNINFLIDLFYQKVSQSRTDEQASNAQSGKALGKQFEKLESLLRFGSQSMEDTEIWLYETAALWEEPPVNTDELSISYTDEYQTEDLHAALAILKQITLAPYETAQKEAWSQMILKSLPNSKPEVIKTILAEIENTEMFSVDEDTGTQNINNVFEKLTNGSQSPEEEAQNAE